MFIKTKQETPEERKARKAKIAARKRERRKAGDIPASDLINKADALARAYCKRDGECQAQGYRGIKCSARLEWAHCVGRDDKYLKHNPLNCFCLCWAHHAFFTSHPYLFTVWVEEKDPGRWERLYSLRTEATEKMLKPDYEYWIDYYKRQGVKL